METSGIGKKTQRGPDGDLDETEVSAAETPSTNKPADPQGINGDTVAEPLDQSTSTRPQKVAIVVQGKVSFPVKFRIEVEASSSDKAMQIAKKKFRKKIAVTDMVREFGIFDNFGALADAIMEAAVAGHLIFDLEPGGTLGAQKRSHHKKKRGEQTRRQPTVK